MAAGKREIGAVDASGEDSEQAQGRMRDPVVDPRPGDVLNGKYGRTGVEHVLRSCIWISVPGRRCLIKQRHETFRKWACSAQTIYRAEANR